MKRNIMFITFYNDKYNDKILLYNIIHFLIDIYMYYIYVIIAI